MTMASRRKTGFADSDVQKTSGGERAVSAGRNILRGEIKSWRVGSTGLLRQSPERPQRASHIEEPGKLIWSRLGAAKRTIPKSAAIITGLPVACWGTPGIKASRITILYNTNLPVKEKVARTIRAASELNGALSQRKVVEKNGREVGKRKEHDKLLSEGFLPRAGRKIKGWFIPDVHARRPPRGSRGGNQDLSASRWRSIQPVIAGQSPMASPGRSIFPRVSSAWRSQKRCSSLRQCKGTHDRLEFAGSDPGASVSHVTTVAARFAKSIQTHPGTARQFGSRTSGLQP